MPLINEGSAALHWAVYGMREEVGVILLGWVAIPAG